jgi:hypothetical protein
MSGKAMQETVPPAGTANWEMLNALESEGHVAFVRPLLLPIEEALLTPKENRAGGACGPRSKSQ